MNKDHLSIQTPLPSSEQGFQSLSTTVVAAKHKDPSQMGTNDTDFQEPRWVSGSQHFNPQATPLAYAVVTVLTASTFRSGKPTPRKP